MKKSNLLILIAVLLVLISVGYYDYSVKQAFDSGRYKDPYDGYKALSYKAFDTVDVNSSTATNVKFEQGPFRIIIDSVALDYSKITQKGSRLQIIADFKGQGYHYDRKDYLIVIRCPKLSAINVNAMYNIHNGKTYIDTIVRDSWNMKQVLIDGFKQDSLRVNQDYGSTVVFDHNTIKIVTVKTGKSIDSGSKTIVLKDNRFDNATFDIGNKSRLFLNDAEINTMNFHLADSAQLITTGAAQNIINHSKPIQK